jgi:hypothetical protein
MTTLSTKMVKPGAVSAGKLDQDEFFLHLGNI